MDGVHVGEHHVGYLPRGTVVLPRTRAHVIKIGMTPTPHVWLFLLEPVVRRHTARKGLPRRAVPYTRVEPRVHRDVLHGARALMQLSR